MSTGQVKSQCPYCGMELDPAPKKKKACPHCGKFIFVRKRRLLTEDDAAIEDWLLRLALFNVTRKDFDTIREKLSNQFGVLASVNDTVWTILNEQVSKGRDLHTIRTAYYEMARLASLEGKDPKPYCTEALRTQLYELKSMGVKTVKIVGYGRRSDSSCSKCKSLHGKKLNIETALREMPIPTVCEDEFGCKCEYLRAE